MILTRRHKASVGTATTAGATALYLNRRTIAKAVGDVHRSVKIARGVYRSGRRIGLARRRSYRMGVKSGKVYWKTARFVRSHAAQDLIRGGIGGLASGVVHVLLR